MLRGRTRFVCRIFIDPSNGGGGAIGGGSDRLRLGLAGRCTKCLQETPSLDRARLLAPMRGYAAVRVDLGGTHDAFTRIILTMCRVTSSTRTGRRAAQGERRRVGVCWCGVDRPESNSLAELLHTALRSSNRARRLGVVGPSPELGGPAGTRARSEVYQRPT